MKFYKELHKKFKKIQGGENIMRRILKYVLLILLFSLAILFLNQLSVNAAEVITVNTLEELKTALGENDTIVEGNTIKLTDNVILEDFLNVNIPELIIDFNGKTIEMTSGIIIYNKVTFKDSSTADRFNWGGIIFNRCWW